MRIRHLSAVVVATSLLTACAGDPSGVPDFSSTCRDEAGDGIGQFDIAEVDLVKSGDTVTMTFALDAAVDSDHFAEAGYLVNIYTPDGERRYQLGVKHRDGFQTANFVFNHRSGQQTNYDTYADFEDGVLTAEYSTEDLLNLQDFTWEAVMTDGSDDLDVCADIGRPRIAVP